MFAINQKGNRIIEVNHRLNKYKELVREALNSKQGTYYRKKRPCDVEPVFASIKNNHHFKRFMLRTKPKTEIEAGLLAIAHNLSEQRRQPEKGVALLQFLECRRLPVQILTQLLLFKKIKKPPHVF